MQSADFRGLDPGAAERNARLLGVLRVVIFTLSAYTVSSAPLSALALIPLDLLEPVWILRPLPREFWQWLFRPQVLVVLQASMVAVSLGAAVGVRPYRPIAMMAAALLTFDQALKRSWGYDGHPDILTVLASWVVATAPAADRVSWPRRSRLSAPAGRYASAIALVATLGCFTYVAAAAYRSAHHSFASFCSPTMLYAVVQNSFRHGSGDVGAYFLQRPELAGWLQPLVPLATALELAAPLALLWRRFRRLWLLFPLVFHPLAALVMGVSFWETMIIVVVSMLAFDRMMAANPR